MSSEKWPRYALSELFTIISGGTPKTTIPEYWNGNIPWLSVADFGNCTKYTLSAEKSITEIGLKNSAANLLNPGQLIISARGTVGALAVLNKTMAFNQSCYGLDANNKTFNDFLFYLLKYHMTDLKSKTHGAVFDTITRETFNHISVHLPDIKTQTRIASILSSLDDKIELNRQTNKTLEEIAQTLFKEMCLPKGDVLPEGWRVCPISEIIEVKDGTHNSPKPCTFGKYLITSRHLLKDGSINFAQAYRISLDDYREINKRSAVANFDILYSMIGTIGNILLVNSGEINFAIKNMGLFKTSDNPAFIYFIFLYLQSDFANNYFKGHHSGSTQQYITLQSLRSLPVILPPVEVLSHFNKLVLPLFNLKEKVLNEIQTLTDIRDTLLPKLMRGEIEL